MALMRRMSMYTLRHMSRTCASFFSSSSKKNPRFFAVVVNDTIL